MQFTQLLAGKGSGAGSRITKRGAERPLLLLLGQRLSAEIPPRGAGGRGSLTVNESSHTLAQKACTDMQEQAGGCRQRGKRKREQQAACHQGSCPHGASEAPGVVQSRVRKGSESWEYSSLQREPTGKGKKTNSLLLLTLSWDREGKAGYGKGLSDGSAF